MSWFQLSARSNGGAVAEIVRVAGANIPPVRASSALSPRSRRRCLHVRRSIGSDWFRQLGHEQERTPPTFFSMYGRLDEPCISMVWPSTKSVIRFVLLG